MGTDQTRVLLLPQGLRRSIAKGGAAIGLIGPEDRVPQRTVVIDGAQERTDPGPVGGSAGGVHVAPEIGRRLGVGKASVRSFPTRLVRR